MILSRTLKELGYEVREAGNGREALDVLAAEKNAVDLILDGGPCSVGIESTVISLVGARPKILRPGMISRPEIEAVIGPVEVGAGAESPG